MLALDSAILNEWIASIAYQEDLGPAMRYLDPLVQILLKYAIHLWNTKIPLRPGIVQIKKWRC